MTCCDGGTLPPRDRVAICHMCTHGGSWRRNAIACTIDGAPIVDRAACPLARWDRDGRVRWWWGLRWIGIPRPLRWALRIVGVRGPWFGCGCLADSFFDYPRIDPGPLGEDR